MHETPRYYGTYEQFLKMVRCGCVTCSFVSHVVICVSQLGVREKPSAGDYSKFLAELAAECKETGLNPNELRAVVAIVQVLLLCG